MKQTKRSSVRPSVLRSKLRPIAACLLAWNLFSPGGATAADNTITGGTYTDTDIYGNKDSFTDPDDASASNNTLTLGDGVSGPTISSSSHLDVVGGQALGDSNGSANNNTLTVNHGTTLGGSGDIYLVGGQVTTGNGAADGNAVIINGFTPTGNSIINVYGGNSGGSGAVSNNRVTIATGVTNNFASIYGGRAGSGSVTDNTVTINGGTVSGEIYGGRAYAGSGASVAVSGNAVTIDGGTTQSNVIGGYASGDDTVEINNNTVSITGDNEVGGAVYGGRGYGFSDTLTVDGNEVSIENSRILADNVFGGWADAGNDGAGTGDASASGNTVTLNGGSAGGHVYGGEAISTKAASAGGNTVTVEGVSVEGSVAGGRAYGDSAEASNNTVSITGGTVNGQIIGGEVYGSSGNTAAHNTVSIYGSVVFDPSSALYGGMADGSGAGDLFTGNTLNKNSDAAVPHAANFEFVNFGYSGNANISTLDTTPTGAAAAPLVKLNNLSPLTFGGTITGMGGIEKTGGGTLILTGVNDYSGNTTVSAGILEIGSDDNIGGGTNTLSGGDLRLSGSTGTTYGKDWTLAGTDDVISNADDAAMSGVLSGSGSLTKTGAGTLTLTGTNTYGGDTTVIAGTLAGNIADNTPLTVESDATYGGTDAARSINTLAGDGTVINTSGLSVQSGVFGGTLSGTGTLTKTGTGILTLSGNNTYTGNTALAGGELHITGTLGADNNNDYAGNITNTGTLVFDQTADQTLSGTLSGAGSLTKSGEGTLTISAASDISGFSGGIAVNGGTLELIRNSGTYPSFNHALTGIAITVCINAYK